MIFLWVHVWKQEPVTIKDSQIMPIYTDIWIGYVNTVKMFKDFFNLVACISLAEHMRWSSSE